MLNLTYGERNRECEVLQSLISHKRNERSVVCGESYMLFPRREWRWAEGREGGQRICAREGEKGGSACLIWNGCYSDHTPGCQLWHGSLLRPTPKWQIKDTPQWPSSLSSSPLALSLSLSLLVFSSHPSLLQTLQQNSYGSHCKRFAVWFKSAVKWSPRLF